MEAWTLAAVTQTTAQKNKKNEQQGAIQHISAHKGRKLSQMAAIYF